MIRFIALAGRAIQRAYEEQTADAQQRVAERQALIAQKEREKTQAFNLLMNPNNPPEVVSMCQERISMLTAQIQQLTDEQQVQEIETMPLDQATEYVLQFIRRPLDIWRTGNFKKRQGVLNLCFPEQISYDFAEKFGTPKLAPIFNVFDENVGEIKKWRIQKDCLIPIAGAMGPFSPRKVRTSLALVLTNYRVEPWVRISTLYVD